VIESTDLGQSTLRVLDRATDPLWRRLEDFIRAVVAAFFVAIFAVGGVYLTPDLRTPSEWVSRAQPAIAALVFFRRTMPLAAAGIIGLWLLALRDYDFFHLLDYLALGVGVGVAAYLMLFALPADSRWRRYRFHALRIGVAAALIWSSLETFAYPEWFNPLVVEKPFLTFGMPRDVFIPMAGVAEFTMGFGLLCADRRPHRPPFHWLEGRAGTVFAPPGWRSHAQHGIAPVADLAKPRMISTCEQLFDMRTNGWRTVA
jgi:hypothetical protein